MPGFPGPPPPSVVAVSEDPNTPAVTGESLKAGTHTGFAGDGVGVLGSSGTSSGVSGISQSGDGVHGSSSGGNGSGVRGENRDAGTGVSGSSVSGNGVAGTSQTGNGGWFESKGDGVSVFGRANGQAAGVSGFNVAPAGAKALGAGVWGDSKNANGVFGIAHGQAAGVSGVNDAPAAPQGAPAFGAGVWGDSRNADGVMGISHSKAGAGVSANNDAGGYGLYATASGPKPAGHFDGDVTVNGTLNVSGDVFLGGQGQDCAEQFNVSAKVTAEPGTVMVINGEGELEPSQLPYDKKAAGVISGAGDLRPAIILGKEHSERNTAFVALVGKVYCKVDADHASIEVGDLLTTSPTLGHAMKAEDPIKAFGAVIGKALRPLESGHGLIPILIALQ